MINGGNTLATKLLLADLRPKLHPLLERICRFIAVNPNFPPPLVRVFAFFHHDGLVPPSEFTSDIGGIFPILL